MTTLGRLHERMDRLCKYVVVAAVVTVSLATTPVDGSSIRTPVVVALSVVTALCGKVLKRVLNHNRPHGSKKLDGGMPSSHAVSLAYLSISASLYLAASEYATASASLVNYATVFINTSAMYFIWLRVHLGHHTAAQVVVGYAFGGLSAAAVFQVAHSRLETLPLAVKQGVLCACVALCVVCLLRFGRAWLSEDFKKSH